jgi:AcrR family transcriptional regulator
MSPRGVAIQEVERQLFDAAERVLNREGPEGLTSRAITDEAGTAKGLLYRHFKDLDTFLAAFVLDRIAQLTSTLSGLRQSAGTGSVVDNLTQAALAVRPRTSSLIDLVRARWSIAAHLGRTAHEQHAGQLREIERIFSDYLDAERALGRLKPGTDTHALATALFGAVHQLALMPQSEDERDDQIRRVVRAVLAGNLAEESASAQRRDE